MAQRKVGENVLQQLAESSVPGLSYMAKSRIRKQVPVRLAWLTVLLLLLGLTTYMIYQRMQYFHSNPVSLDITTEARSTLEFPAVVICNWNPLRLSAVIKFNNFTASNPTTSVSAALLATPGNAKLQDILPELAHQPQDMVHDCLFEQKPCKLQYVSSVLTDMGLCAAFNLNGSVKATREMADKGLSLVINMEPLDYLFNVNSPKLDNRLKHSETLQNPHKASVNVFVGWAGDLPLYDIRTAGIRLENGQSISFLVNAEEHKISECDDLHKAQTLSVYNSTNLLVDVQENYSTVLVGDSNATYTKRKCERALIATERWEKCQYQPWYAPYANASAAEQFSYHDWLFLSTENVSFNISERQKAFTCVENRERQESMAALAGLPDLGVHEDALKCPRECYAITYNTALLYNQLAVVDLSITDADQNPDEAKDDDIKFADVGEIQKFDSAEDRKTALNNFKALNSALAAVDLRYSAVLEEKQRIKTALRELFRAIDAIYRGTRIKPIYLRPNGLKEAAIMTGGTVREPFSGENATRSDYLANVWFSRCDLPNQQMAHPVQVAHEVEQLWFKIREYMTSRSTWRKFRVVTKNQPPFEFLGQIRKNLLEANTMQNWTLLFRNKTLKNFADIDIWYENLSKIDPNLQKAVRAYRYPIVRRITWNACPTKKLNEPLVNTTAATEVVRSRTSAEAIEYNSQNEFWKCFDVLRVLFETHCLGNSTDVSEEACRNVTTAVDELYEEICDEQEFDDIREALKNDKHLEQFSKSSDFWFRYVDSNTKQTLYPSEEWENLHKLSQNFGESADSSFTKLVDYYSRKSGRMSEQLVTEMDAFIFATQQYHDEFLQRNFRKMFGLGQLELSEDPKRWWYNENEKVFVNNYMIRFLRRTDAYARNEIFDLPMAKAIDTCFQDLYSVELYNKQQFLWKSFDKVDELLKNLHANHLKDYEKLVDPPQYKDWYQSSFAEVKVRFTNTILKTTVERKSFDFWALLSDLGGIVGLTLGVSFITIVELLYVFAYSLIWKDPYPTSSRLTVARHSLAAKVVPVSLWTPRTTEFSAQQEKNEFT